MGGREWKREERGQKEEERGDKGYGWRRTRMCRCVWDEGTGKGERTDGTFSRSDFTWDDENDRYICPGGKEMRHTWRTYSDTARNTPTWKARKYRARKSDCTGCALKAKCCPNSEARAVHREKY